jgi:LysR family transcriptional regulator, nitrogen assimilation regulatory protein
MDARSLRYFVQVSDSRSFSKAANFLHIGQPALSRCIQHLEEELGVQLFQRTRHGVELTVAGQILRTRSKLILDQLGQLSDEVRAHAHDVTGTAVVGVPAAAGQIIVPEVMRHLSEQYTGVRLHIVEGLSSETYDRLLGRTVQIGLMYDASAHRDLSCEPLAIEDMCLVGRRDKIAALGTIRDLAQVENLPLILPKSPNSRRLLVEKAFRERGLVLNVVAEIDGFATTRALLSEGFGHSLMTQAALFGPGGHPSLVAVGLESNGLQWRLDLVRHRSQVNSQVINVVAAVIRKVVEQLNESGRWKGVTPLQSTKA